MEIFNNTIFQLVVRQGPDTDRKQTLLKSGEFGYTTDTRRLYIGNGVLSGGDVVGNKFIGSAATITDTTLQTSVTGDLGFSTDTNKLYRLVSGSGASLSDWQVIGGVYTSSSPYITINSLNSLNLKALSANSLDQDVVKGPIILDSGKLSLSSKIPFTTVSTNTILITGGLVATGNGSNITGVAVNPLSTNIIIQSNQIYAKYEGLSGGSGYSRNITSILRLSAGDYLFKYGPLTTSNVIPMVQIYGYDSFGYDARVYSANLSACSVHILSGSNKTDANVYLSIIY